MKIKSATVFLTGLAAQQVVASGWNNAPPYSCPGNTPNHCSPDQQNGYDWSNLNTGSFNSYGGNQFSGFSCSNSFGKRNALARRGFQSKCITGNLDDGPSMSGDAFSIDSLQISSSHDADVELHYGMPDGSTCKEVQSCSTSGSTFQNTQCGGAKSVTFKPGKNAPHGCQIGVHKIKFHCGSPPSKPQPSSSVSPQSSGSPPCYGKHCTSSSAPSPPCYGKKCQPSSSPVAPASSSAPSPPCYGGQCSLTSSPVSSSAPSPPCYGGKCSPSSSPVAPVSSSAPSPPCYGGQCSPSSSPVAPASSSAPSPPCYGGQCSPTSSSVAPVSSSPPPAYSTPPAYSPTSVSPVSSSPPSYQPPSSGCPDVLPRCMKTWIALTKCKDNSDHNCLCPDEKFVKNVMSCLSAWSSSDSETAAAASYLMGICAASIPKNPAIVTACPPGITPGPPKPAASSPAQKSPPCTTITWKTTTITVPKVQFTTKTITVEGTTSCSVGLGQPTPNSAPAYTSSSPASAPAPYPTPASSPPQYGSSSAVGAGTGAAMATGSASPSSYVPVANEGVRVGFGGVGVVLGVVAALAAL